MTYNFKEIESKWQKYWENNKTFKAVNGSNKKPYYILVEFDKYYFKNKACYFATKLTNFEQIKEFDFYELFSMLKEVLSLRGFISNDLIYVQGKMFSLIIDNEGKAINFYNEN